MGGSGAVGCGNDKIPRSDKRAEMLNRGLACQQVRERECAGARMWRRRAREPLGEQQLVQEPWWENFMPQLGQREHFFFFFFE
jgi:hypothetical protein